MSQGKDENSRPQNRLRIDLEPYRRLIELQKQMIELAQQHERTKRECTALREQLLEEMTAAAASRWRCAWNALVGRQLAEGHRAHLEGS